MNIVYSLTRNLYPCLECTIKSLLEYNKDVKVFVLAEDDELPFEIPCEHEIINMSQQKYFLGDCANIRNSFTYMAMLRVCTADIIKEDKVIQLDIDTIVCDSLEPLWNTDLTGRWVAWCQEYYGRYKPYGDKYYNFGVAVLNLEQMRKDNAVPFMVKELNKHRFNYIDQDVMNLFAVPDKSVDISVRYNESFCCGYTDNPAIVHYAGFPDWFTNMAVPRWEYLAKYLD